MKKRLLTALPEVYSFGGNDYSRFLVGSAEQLMEENWRNVGKRLGDAIGKVGNVINNEKAKKGGGSCRIGQAEHSACVERKRDRPR